jgi:hypothetical protein
MVEIKHGAEPGAPALSRNSSDPDVHEESRHRLVYSKSKVYIHPTGARAPGLRGAVERLTQRARI